jgi:hypothetical protein
MATYMLISTSRYGGDATVNRRNLESVLAMFAAWAPPDDVKILNMVSAVDLSRTFLLLETDNPASLALICGQTSPWAHNEVVAVVPSSDSAQIVATAIGGG